jgi:phage-related minor tail protein
MSGGAATVGRLVVSVSGDVGQLAIDMREAQTITDQSTKAIVNSLQGITEATYARNDAGKRMLAAMQEEINTFGMSSDELKVYKASLLGVGDQAAALIERLNGMRAAQSGFTDQLSASEAQATQRIKEMVAASLQEVTAMNAAAAATQGAAAAQAQLNSVAGNWAATQRLQAQNMAGVAASMKSATEGTAALSLETQRILDRYDPLGTKLRALESELATLRKAMGDSVDPAAIKAFQGLEEEIVKTKTLMQQAGVDGFGAVENGAKKSAFATAGATRELMVLGHEVISGNFSRIPGSLMVLAERMGGITEFLNPMSIGLVALGVAGLGLAGAMLAGHDQMVGMNNAMLVTSEYAGASRQSMQMLAESMTQTHEVTIGVANGIVLALTASGKVGADAIGQVARFTSDFAKSTGQDVKELAPKMIQLFTDPLKGAEELNSSMHFLTTTQIEHIAALERTGQVQAAQTELAKAAADHMPKQAQNIGVVTQAVLDQRDAWTKLWQAMVQAGAKRDQPDQQAQDLRDQISEYLARGLTRKDPAVKAVQAQLDALEPAIQKQKELTKAEQDAAAANELQAKSWDAVKASSTAYHVQELQDRLKLIQAHKSEAGPDFASQEAAKSDAIRKTQDEIDAATRSMTAEGRQLYDQQMANQDALAQVKLKQSADDVETLYKLGKISKEDFDQRMLMIALEENQDKQNYERAILRRADLSSVEYKAHQQKLALLQAKHDAIESKGVNAQLVDEKKSYDDIFKAAHDAGVASIASLDQQILKQREHNAEIGKTKAQIELAKQAAEDMQTAQLQSDADYLRDGLAKWNLDAQSMAIYQMRLNDLDEEIAKRREISGLLGDASVKEANAKAAEEAAKSWKHSADQIEQSLTDALLRGFEAGKGFGQNLVDTLKHMFGTLVLRPIIQAVLMPVSGAFASALVPTAAQAAGTAAAAPGSAAGLVGAAQVASSLYKVMSGGFAGLSDAVAGGVQSAMSAVGYYPSAASGLATASGQALTPMASMAGTAAGYGAGLLGGHYIGNAISGDYSVGNHGQAVVNIASVVGAIVGGPIGAAIGGAIGGIVNRAFGHGATEVQSQGYRGTLGDTTTGESYQKLHQDGGWFTSDKNWTTDTPFSDTKVAQFAQGFDALKTTLGGFATSVGATADLLSGYTKTFDIATTGEAQKDQQAVTDFFATLGDEMATKLVPNLADFTKSGESASAALQRLAGDFQTTDQMAQLLGKTAAQVFGDVGMASAAARERLVDLSGGASVLAQQTASYAQAFLTDAQRLVPVQKALDAAMASLGLSSVQTRAQFKGVVDSLDLTTEAGAQEFTSLMKLADAFAQVHPAIDATTAALDAQAAAQQAIKDAATTALGNVDSAYSVLQAVVAREKAALQTRVDAETAAITKLQSLSQALHGTLDALKGPDQAAYDRLAAQGQIKAALAIAKAGGPLPRADALKGALSTLTQDSSGQFATYADYLKDFYSTKNDIASLAGITDDSLSVEQKSLDALNAQVKQLDSVLAEAQSQIDVLKGQSTTLLSIDDAVRGLSAAILAAQANPVVATTSAVNQAYQSALGRAPDAAGLQFWQGQAAAGTPVDDIVKSITGSPEATLRGMYQTMLGRAPDAAGLNFWMGQLGKGVSLSAIGSAIAGSGEATTHAGIPGFATGGDFGGGLRIVGENGPELEATGPARIFNASQTSSILSRLSSPSEGNAALLQEIKALRVEVAQLRVANSAENVAQVKQQQGTNAMLERVIYGGDAIQTKPPAS